LTLSPYENFQTYGLLRASEYTYSKLYSYEYSTADEEIINTGSKIILAAGVQVNPFMVYLDLNISVLGKKQC
jgi:hypothetical protein